MRRASLVVLAVIASVALARPARAEVPAAMTIAVPGAAALHVPGAPSSRILYLNRCGADGCNVRQGNDDARTQTSSIASGAVTIGAFTQGDAVWQQVVACVTATYAPFDVIVTDGDPASLPHFETIFGGVPSDLRSDIAGAGGVAPFDCAEIPNAVSYVFDVYGPDALSLCWTAAQEAAHGFGLDHELLQGDPMTYIGGALPKRFQPVDAQCGEDVARACRCPETTQNSFRLIEAMFGDGAPTPPTLAIVSPVDGASVQPTVAIRATASDDVAVDHLELWIDGAQVGMSAVSPWVFAAPGLALGPHTIELRAYDIQNTGASTSIAVTVVPPCGPSAPCATPLVCASGACIDGPSVSGGLGAGCTNNGQCLLEQCASDGGDGDYCVAACDPTVAGACPSGFSCDPTAGSDGECWPAATGGGCDAGGARAGALLLLAVLGAWSRLRRRGA